MKYVIDMRNRKIQISPFYERNNRTRNNDENGNLNFSSNDNAGFKTLNDELINSRQRRKIRIDIKKKIIILFIVIIQIFIKKYIIEGGLLQMNV